MSEFADSAYVLEIGVDSSDAGVRARVKHKEILNFGRGLRGDDKVNVTAVFLKIFYTLNKLFTGGNLKVGPGVHLKSDINVRTFSAAHCKDFCALDFKYLTAHKVKNV